MPVRIYDIALKLGLENKQVLAKAKELGILQARVASSVLDKITGEYLEEQLRTSPPPPPPNPSPPPVATSPEPSQPQPKAAGITIRVTGPEIHRLVERIFSGELSLTIEIAQDEGSPAIRANLVSEHIPTTPAFKPKLDPPPRAELSDQTKRIFLGAYYIASSASKDEWVNLAEYGNTLKRQFATFQPMDYGERSLGGLIRRMTDIFEIKTDSNTPPVYHIRRKANAEIIHTPPQLLQPPSSPPAHRATGKVHNLRLGFGFIAPDDGSENIFFHATEVVGCTIFDLRPGDPVEYQSGVNEKGPCAFKVQRLTSNPHKSSAFPQQ
jgi:cold shock CspA family protein